MFTFIAGIIGRTGVAGVFLLMLVENLVPAIPSELILPLAGFEASQGAFPPVAAIAAGAAGSILGGVAWYGLGRRLGLERFRRLAARGGRWLAITPREVDQANAWFRRNAALAVCLGRAIPGVRGVICLPAGMARMPFASFLLWSSIGAALWSAVLVGAGLVLGQRYAAVELWVNPVADAFFGVCVAAYLWRVVRPSGRPGRNHRRDARRAAEPGRQQDQHDHGDGDHRGRREPAKL